MEVIDAGETICISCGARTEKRRARCLECGAPQRRLRLVGGRVPAGPLAAAGLVAALMLAALVVMMVADQKAGPSRAYEELRDAATGGECDEVWNLMSAEAQSAYANREESCRLATEFGWGQADIANVQIDSSNHATLCVSQPPGYGLYLTKDSGRWLVDAATPTARSECIADPTGDVQP